MGGVEGDWEEKETCLKTSPLTLTVIIKGPKNRAREREVEIGREEEVNREINQIQIDSAALEEQQRKEGLSPILTLSLNPRQVHHDQAGSSEHQGNNIDLMDMLKVMR